jgi:hypothetical protein
MSRQCTTCSRNISPQASTSPLATPSPDTTIVANTALQALQLESFLWDSERGYRDHQPAHCLQDVETFQSVREWHEFPNTANYWLGPAQSPTNSYVTGDQSLSHEEYCLDNAEPYRPEVIDTSEPPSISVCRPETSSSGDYRCYQHGCEGRRFSSSENYRRHIRERNKLDRTTCPFCAAVFTRKSNKNTHLRKGRCKGTFRWFSEHINILSNGETSLEGTHEPPLSDKRW